MKSDAIREAQELWAEYSSPQDREDVIDVLPVNHSLEATIVLRSGKRRAATGLFASILLKALGKGPSSDSRYQKIKTYIRHGMPDRLFPPEWHEMSYWQSRHGSELEKFFSEDIDRHIDALPDVPVYGHQQTDKG